MMPTSEGSPIDPVAATPPPGPRPFTLRDAMALVGATAVGLGVTRGLFGRYIAAMAEALGDPSRTANLGASAYVELTLYVSAILGLPVLAAWTVALALLSRPQRGERRRRGPRPGFAAMVMAAGTILIGIGTAVGAFVYKETKWSGRVDWPDLSEWTLKVFLVGFGAPGLAVAVAWLLLWLAGRWRPERSWHDRAGRALGLVWLLLLLVWPGILLVML